MKFSIILLSCVCSSLAITVHYETSLAKNTKENQNALKDIRLVPISQDESLQKPTVVNAKESDGFKTGQRARESVKANRQAPRIKSRGEKRKPALERVGNTKQTPPVDPEHRLYMQKVANQLFTAQKHASLLSDYQKFILNQDQNVKNFVLGQSTQERNPKPFSRHQKIGRALPVAPTQEPAAAANAPLQKIVVVTPRVQTTLRKNFQRHVDHSAQAAHVKYVTIPPQYLVPQEPPRKVTLLPYHSTPQPYAYYEIPVTAKPETVQIPPTLSAGLGAFESPHHDHHHHHHNEDDDGLEDNVHHDTKYEFMYRVNDHHENNNFGHKESRTDKTTYGYYYVHLPDGRLETVKYWADKTGYHAKVDYEGEAKHPSHGEHDLHSHNLLRH